MKNKISFNVTAVTVLLSLFTFQSVFAGGFELEAKFGNKTYYLPAILSEHSHIYAIEHGEIFQGDTNDVIASGNYEIVYSNDQTYTYEDQKTLFFPSSGSGFSAIKPVCAIEDFNEIETLENIIIENGIRGIFYSFNLCSKLKTAVIPESVKIIDNCFYTSYELQNKQPLVIYGKKGSFAETFAEQEGFDFKEYISVIFNDKEVYSEQPATIIDSRTLVPVRAIFEAMGASVDWDETTNTVISEKNNIKIRLSIGSNQLYVNDSLKTIDVPAQLINDRTMVPARAIAEAFDCNVQWDETTKTVCINE